MSVLRKPAEPVGRKPGEARPIAAKPPIVRPPVAHPPVAPPKPPKGGTGHAPSPTKPVTMQTSRSIKVFLATAEKCVDFLKFSAVPQPGETAAGRFSRHCLHYNAVCCMLATLHHIPAKRRVFTTTLFGTLRGSLDLLHLGSLFMSLLAWAEAEGDAELVADAQALWRRLDGAARLAADLPWVAIYDAKRDRLGIVASTELAAALVPWIGKPLPAGFAAGLAASTRQSVAAPFAAKSAASAAPHAVAAVAAPKAASGPQVDPTAVTVLAGLGCAGSLAAVIGTTLSVPETGAIGAALTLRIIGGMASADGACSVFLLRMTADSTSASTPALPEPVPVSPGEPVIDPSGNSCVEPFAFSTDPGDGPVSSDPGDEPVSSDPGDGPASSDPGDGPVSSDPGSEPVSSDPGNGPSGSEPSEGSGEGSGSSSSGVGFAGGGSGGDAGGGGGGPESGEGGGEMKEDLRRRKRHNPA